MKIVRVRDRRRSAYGHKRRWQYVIATEPRVSVNSAKGFAKQLDDAAADALAARLSYLSPGHEVEAVPVDEKDRLDSSPPKAALDD